MLQWGKSINFQIPLGWDTRGWRGRGGRRQKHQTQNSTSEIEKRNIDFTFGFALPFKSLFNWKLQSCLLAWLRTGIHSERLQKFRPLFDGNSHMVEDRNRSKHISEYNKRWSVTVILIYYHRHHHIFSPPLITIHHRCSNSWIVDKKRTFFSFKYFDVSFGIL